MYKPEQDIDITLAENKNFVNFVIKKYYPYHIGNEDLEQEGLIALWRAIEKFDESKGYTFTTFAAKVLRNHFLKIFEKDNNKIKPISLNTVVAINDTGEETTLEDTVPLIKDIDTTYIDCVDYLKDCPQLLKEMLVLRAKGYGEADIGKIYNISKQAVNNRLQRAKKEYFS